MAMVPSHAPQAHRCQTFVLKQILSFTPYSEMSQAWVWFLKTHCLFHGRVGSRLGARGAGESGREWERDEALGGLSVAKWGWARALPRLHRKLSALSPFAGSRPVHAFPVLDSRWIPT